MNTILITVLSLWVLCGLVSFLLAFKHYSKKMKPFHQLSLGSMAQLTYILALNLLSGPLVLTQALNASKNAK